MPRSSRLLSNVTKFEDVAPKVAFPNGWKSPYYLARTDGRADAEDEQLGDAGDVDDGGGGGGLALERIAQEDDDDRGADGEESDVAGCDCDGPGKAMNNEGRLEDSVDFDDDEDDLTNEELEAEEEAILDEMTANGAFVAASEDSNNSNDDEDDEDDTANRADDLVDMANRAAARSELRQTRDVIARSSGSRIRRSVIIFDNSES